MANKYRGRNEGSISKRPNGSFRGQVTVQNGKRVSATFKIKTDAQRWIRDQLMMLDKGFDFQGSKITLAEYLPKWLEHNKNALRDKTSHNYLGVINRHIIPNIGKITLRDLRLAKIEEFYLQLTKTGLGARTVRICHNILHKSLEKALRYGLVSYNPTQGASLPRYSHGEIQVLDEAQVSQFLVAAKSSPYCALYYLAVTTGMRLGELFGLKWIDLQWTSGALHVQRQVQRVDGQGWSFVEPKTKSGIRTIKLGEGTLQVLREHKIRQEAQKQLMGERWQENGLVFPSSVGTPCDPSNMRSDYNATLANAGVPKIRFHDLRHTAASLLLNHNVPVIVVSKMLGHAKASVTLDIYGHLYHEMQGEASMIMDRLVTPIQIQLPVELIKAER